MNLDERFENFKLKSNKVHNNFYDYSLVKYKNNKTKVTIICPIHGEFEQLVYNHVNGSGCKKCFISRLDNSDENFKKFKDKSNKVHNNFYDYSLVNYKNNKTKVTITCPIHGNFSQIPSSHTNGNGCPICGNIKSSISFNEFVNRSNIKHNFKYKYFKESYKNGNSNIMINCPIHGDFIQNSKDHMDGSGCKKCSMIESSNKRKMNISVFIKTSNKIHNDKYDYSLVDYKNSTTLIDIICPLHGLFTVKPVSHIHSNKGCPTCYPKILSKGESRLANIFDKYNIYYISEYRFESCKDKNELRFDFYLPEHNYCIEYDGKQHFQVVEHFGGQDKFEDIKEKDNIKNNFCEYNKINLLRIPYTEYENIEEILKENNII